MTARREPPEELLRAIAEHFRESLRRPHPELKQALLAREGTRNARKADIVWREPTGSESGRFRCSHCRAGANFYLSDVYASAPTERALPAIRRHFAELHGIEELPLEQIAYEGNMEGEKLASWLPLTPRSEASFVCSLCPEGGDRIFVGEPAYGDARRNAWLTMRRPELWEEMKDLAPTEQALYLEAWDRGLLQRVSFEHAKRLLQGLHAERKEREPSPVEAAFRRLLLAAVASGRPISEAIADLVALQEDETTLRCRIGAEIADMAPYLEEDMSARDFAKLVGHLYGDPRRTRRTLWTYWRRTSQADREAAELAGKRCE